MNERTAALLKLFGFVLFIFLVGFGSLFLLEKEHKAKRVEPWQGWDDKVVEILKGCEIPGTKGNVLQLTSGYLEMAKAGGNFIEFEGWYAFQVSDSLYEAGVGYKVNGIRKTARWDVDLVRRTIKPRNQEAFIFGGNNDLLRY
jgi:hypothetical protein